MGRALSLLILLIFVYSSKISFAQDGHAKGRREARTLAEVLDSLMGHLHVVRVDANAVSKTQEGIAKIPLQKGFEAHMKVRLDTLKDVAESLTKRETALNREINELFRRALACENKLKRP